MEKHSVPKSIPTSIAMETVKNHNLGHWFGKWCCTARGRFSRQVKNIYIAASFVFVLVLHMYSFHWWCVCFSRQVRAWSIFLVSVTQMRPVPKLRPLIYATAIWYGLLPPSNVPVRLLLLLVVACCCLLLLVVGCSFCLLLFVVAFCCSCSCSCGSSSWCCDCFFWSCDK